MKSSITNPKSNAGFTLIELLVVITIIVVLLALLTPALERAVDAGLKAKCLSNVRVTVQGCQQYALPNRRTLPVYTMSGTRNPDGTLVDGCSAYDLRGPWGGLFATNAPKFPMGVGLLVPAGLLPATQLGGIAHCPVLDNTGGPYPGHCMDRASPWGFGASWWVDNPDYRVINGYNYRAPSYYNAAKGHLMLNKIGSGFVVYVDVPDVRFRGLGGQFCHPEGYSRAMGDGSATFLLDPNHLIEKKCIAIHPPEGWLAGIDGSSVQEEEVYEWMGRGSVVE